MSASEQELVENLLEEFSPTAGDSPIAAVYLSELSLEGDVVEDRVLLTATIVVEVTRENTVFDVPLKLNQAHVQTISHSGPGRASPMTDSQRDDGLHWAIEGQGTHRLELSFWVPLKSSPAGQQLLLTLPPLPEFLVTRIRLRIPGDQRVIRRPTPAGIVSLRQATGEDGLTEVVAEVEGQRLELIWTERRQPADTLSRVVTEVAVRRENDQLLLVGRQAFEVEQGGISQVLLRLPSEFAVQRMSLSSPGEQTAVNHELMPDDPGWLRVHLPEPLHQRFTLDWTLTRPFPEEGGVVRIDGLEIANTGSLQGEILINPVEGYDINWNESRSQDVRRVNVRDESARDSALGAFQFGSLPFRLEIELVPVTPNTDAHATYHVGVEADRLLLVVDVSVQILTGSVQELQFTWPDQLDEAWSVFSNRPQVTLDGESVRADASADGEQLVLALAQPVTGTLHVRWPFERKLTAEETGVDLTLPQINATWLARSVLFVGEAIDVTAVVTAVPEMRAGVEPATEMLDAPRGEIAADRVRGWELADNDTTLHIERVRHERTVSVGSSVTIGLPPDGSVLQVVQEFVYEIAHGRIRTVQFGIPEQILEIHGPETTESGFPSAGLQFLDEYGEPLNQTLEGNLYTVSLGGDRHGTLTVRLEYALPLPEVPSGGRGEYTLPIVQPLLSDVTRTEVYADRNTPLDFVVLDESWQSVPHFMGGNVWHVAEKRDECRLELRIAAREFVQRLRIVGCYLQTVVDESGRATTSGVYELRHPPEEILISLPGRDSEPVFDWNGQPLPFRRTQGQDSETSPYVLVLDESAVTEESGRLSVKYQHDAAAVLGITSDVSVGFPSFGPDAQIEETIWELVLPNRHVLFRFPESMTPGFTWQRKTIFWMRSPTDYIRSRSEEIIGASTGLLSSAQPGYSFITTGTVSRVQVASMTQSFVVLLGAGLTMLLGFVFGRIPAARNVYSLLVLGFLMALVSVWYLDLIQLLVQPALIGLCLAILAVTFDTATRARASREDSANDIMTERHERFSSAHSPAPAGLAQTAVHPEAASAESGSRSHG